MKTTERFDNAVSKLYTAYHEGKLDALDCAKCAVGNICNNQEDWKDSFCLTETEKGIKYHILKANEIILQTGYSHLELANVEQIFVNGYSVGRTKEYFVTPFGAEQFEPEVVFKGLCAVVEYLCELDNIPNVMDYTKLFETENDKPKYQLN